MSETHDLLVIGAGPTGMACAIDAQRAGFSVVLVDKGCLSQLALPLPRPHDLLHHPRAARNRRHALLQPQPEAHPLRSPRVLPQGRRALRARRPPVPERRPRHRLRRRLHRPHHRPASAAPATHHARKLVVATGYYDLPNYLNIPGEDLPKVKHYYHEPHPFFGLDVLVIGGKNSAAIAALDLWRHGARVTLVHRGPEMHRHVKYWILPDINNRIKNGEVTRLLLLHRRRTSPKTPSPSPRPTARVTLPNHFVFALTGYHPDFDFIERLGVTLDPDNARCPICDPATLESNVPGIYLAGVIVAGERTNEIFIENGRFHGKLIAEDLTRKLSAPLAVSS